MLQVGLQVEPLVKEVAHVPRAPLVGAVNPSHGLAIQVALVKTPKVQEDGPDTL